MTGLRFALAGGVLGLLIAADAGAQESVQETASTFELSVANIMRGPEHVGLSPSQVRWTDDGEWVYFQWLPGGEPWTESAAQYRVPAGGGAPERVPDEEADSVGVLLAAGDVSPDSASRVVSYRGDLYLIDRGSLDVTRLTETRGGVSSPVFDRDGRTVYYLSGNNVFSLSLERGLLRQLTDIRSDPPSEPREAEGHRRFLEEQQLELFEAVRRSAEREERERERRERREAAAPRSRWTSRPRGGSGSWTWPAGR
jgi:dipeptidyl aminopeptidase/acylaminoacyl peptidase